MARVLKSGQKTQFICALAILLWTLYMLCPVSTSSRIRVPMSDITRDLEDVFVMIKTGACEGRAKLIAQSQTSLEYVPSKAYFSDLEEQFDDVHLLDTLSGSVDQHYIDTMDEFVLYKKLQERKSCKELDAADLISQEKHWATNGNVQNRGWNLDKWKFLPMLEKSWGIRNDAKWYIVIEIDTFVVWPNLVKYLRYLAKMDPTRPYYFGSLMNLEGQKFAYGGSGSVMSHQTMRRLVDHVKANNTELQQFTRDTWAGDFVLGTALRQIGVPCMAAGFEMIRESVPELPIGAWCRAGVTYHHMTAEETMRFWDFQNRWFTKNPGAILRHRHVFEEYLMPQMKSVRKNWDNLSADEVDAASATRDSANCRKACLARRTCVQYRHVDNKCFISTNPQLGVATETHESKSQSGWIQERISQWNEERRNACTEYDEHWSYD